jgi:hypothetical protein
MAWWDEGGYGSRIELFPVLSAFHASVDPDQKVRACCQTESRQLSCCDGLRSMRTIGLLKTKFFAF